jgi:hypothetical protein
MPIEIKELHIKAVVQDVAPQAETMSTDASSRKPVRRNCCSLRGAGIEHH